MVLARSQTTEERQFCSFVKTFLLLPPIPISGEQQIPSVPRINVRCEMGIKEASVYSSTAI